VKLFLDSALTDEIRYALDLWDIDGITTNPRHVQASGKPFIQVIQEIGDMVAGTDKSVSTQTNPHYHEDHRAIVEEGRKLSKLSPNFVIKIPSTEHGFKACKILKEEGIRSNLTLCFSASQGLQAMRMGAYYVSPFIAWKEANGDNTDQFIQDMIDIRDNYAFETQILVAAIRNGRQIATAAALGADIVTTSFDVYKDAFAHPFTDLGLNRFQDYWDKTPYE